MRAAVAAGSIADIASPSTETQAATADAAVDDPCDLGESADELVPPPVASITDWWSYRGHQMWHYADRKTVIS